MKEEIRIELLKFAETTGIKGIGRMVKATSKVVRFFWFVAVFFCLAFLLFQVWTILISYMSRSVIRNSGVIEKTPIFPDVTICNLFPGYQVTNEAYRKYQTGLDTVRNSLSNAAIDTRYYSNISDQYPWNYLRIIDAYNANTRITEQFTSSEPNASFVMDCSIYGWDLYWPVACNTTPTLTTPLQKCHTLKLESTNGTIAAVQLLVFLNNFYLNAIDAYNNWIRLSTGIGVRVMIHPRNTLPNPKTAIIVSPGNELRIQLKQVNISRLPQPYGNCTTRELLDARLSNSPPYSVFACISLCRQRQMIENCNCLDNNEIFTDIELRTTNRNFCANVTQSMTETPMNLTNIIARANMLLCLSYFTPNENVCDCPTSCSETYYDASSSSARWPNPLFQLSYYKWYKNSLQHYPQFSIYDEILTNAKNLTEEETLRQTLRLNLIEDNFIQVHVMFIEDNVQEITDIPSFNWFTLASNLGGTFNLWLGISIPTVVELIELIYSLILAIFRKSENKIKPNEMHAKRT